MLVMLPLLSALTCDQAPEILRSPDKTVEISFCLDDGAPRYAVRAHGQTVLAPSRLGLTFQGPIDLTAHFQIASTTRRAQNQTWEQVWGESRSVVDHFNEMRADLMQSGSDLKMTLVFRAYDDGIAFRYEVPAQVGLGDYILTAETTEFAFADNPAWWIPAYLPSSYEQLYRRTHLSQIPVAHTPLTIEAAGAFYAVHEAALDDYAAMTLQGTPDGTLRVDLVPWSDGSKVKGQTPLTSPWRTIQIGRRAIDLMSNNLILNLNEPNRLADTSWIHPQKFLGIWWGMHIGRFTWGSGPTHGATTANAKRYIDDAVALKIPALLIEGWNKGWDDWGQSNGFNFVEAMPDFDLAVVAAYARERGIALIGHHETGGAVSNYESQVDAAFALYRSHGVHVVKTGYVADWLDGKEWHDGQFMVRHHRLIAEKAAQYGIMLDIHEPVKDTGLRRTFPNVMSREGARGTEYDAWDNGGGNPPSHTTILPFTRLLSGPMDFTPGIFDLFASAHPEITRTRTTLAKQLALYVVIYSPLQMAADLPENYAGHPAFRFIQDVATDWERTIPLDGAIGEFVAVARQARGTRDWFIGSITNEQARTLNVPLSFLDAGTQYCATIYRDGDGADFATNPLAYEITHESVTAATVLAVKMAPGGGQAMRLSPGSCKSRTGTETDASVKWLQPI